MKIKALRTFTAFDGQMKVFNADSTGYLRDDIAQAYIASGRAAPVGDKPQLDHDADGDAGGSVPHDPPSLTGKNKAELLAIAEAEGVDVEDGATNAAIVDAIETAREADANGDDGGDEAPVA